MSKRYGRNQRRAARRKIADLEMLVGAVRESESRARLQLSRAKEEALTEFINRSDMIKYAMERMGYELGRALGPELEPHARKLMQSDRRGPMLSPDFSASISPVDCMHVLRGTVPELRYNIAVWGPGE